MAIRLKSTEETTFKRIIAIRRPQNIWSDKGTDFKGAFHPLCNSEKILTYTMQSEIKSAYAERNIRSVKNNFYKYLEHKWTYLYIHKLQSFVGTMKPRVNRVSKLAPENVTREHVPQLRVCKEDLPFKKGNKQNFTNLTSLVTNLNFQPTYL